MNFIALHQRDFPTSRKGSTSKALTRKNDQAVLQFQERKEGVMIKAAGKWQRARLTHGACVYQPDTNLILVDGLSDGQATEVAAYLNTLEERVTALAGIEDPEAWVSAAREAIDILSRDEELNGIDEAFYREALAIAQLVAGGGGGYEADRQQGRDFLAKYGPDSKRAGR